MPFFSSFDVAFLISFVFSRALTAEFGDGFTCDNLKNMRQFYKTYANDEICYTLCSRLSWSYNRLIMRVQDSDARNYYLQEAAQEGWSVWQLERNIESHNYQLLLAALNGDKPQTAVNAQFPVSEKNHLFAVLFQ